MLQATSALEDPASLKCEEQAANAAHILAVAALKYQQLDNVTGGQGRAAGCVGSLGFLPCQSKSSLQSRLQSVRRTAARRLLGRGGRLVLPGVHAGPAHP